MGLERSITFILIVLSLAVLFFVMPNQIEAVDYGRVIPSTVPTLVLWVIIGAAVIQLFQSREIIKLEAVIVARVIGFILLLLAAVFAMERFGFEYTAPVLALLIMLAIGERRWPWLLLGGVVIPIGVWLIVEQLLDRPLA